MRIDPLEYMLNTTPRAVQDVRPSYGQMQRTVHDPEAKVFWLLKNPWSGAQWEEYHYDDTRIWLSRDTTAPPDEGNGTAYDVMEPDGMWMPRSWAQGEEFPFAVDILYFNHLEPECPYKPAVEWSLGRHFLRYVGPINIEPDGFGDAADDRLTQLDVIIIDRYHDISRPELEMPKVAERFWYARWYGWVRFDSWTDRTSDSKFDSSNPDDLRNRNPPKRVIMNHLTDAGRAFEPVPCRKPLAALPHRTLTAPRSYAAETWSQGVNVFSRSSFTFFAGAGYGAFVYKIDLPIYRVEGHEASVTAMLASGRSDAASDVTLSVNGTPCGTRLVAGSDPASGGAHYQWRFPETLLRQDIENTITFSVAAEAAHRNGLSMISSLLAPLAPSQIRVSIPAEPIVPIEPEQDAYDAAFLEQQVPALMSPGVTYPVWIKMYNLNSRLWRRDRVWLRSEQPADNPTWDRNRVDLPGSGDLPGHSDAKFEFTVKAPQALGRTLFRWGMAATDRGSFGQRSVPISVMVAKDALFLSQRVPAMIVGGTSVFVEVTFQNIGGVDWTRSADVHLVANGPTSWGLTRVELPQDVAVAPRSDFTFRFPITAPLTAGKYNVQCQLRRGAAALGAPSDAVEVAVLHPVPMAAHFVSQSVPSLMATSTTYKTSVTMRNVGTTTWTKAAQFKLGSKNTDNNAWGVTRVELPHDVPPNGDVTFAFSVRSRAVAQTVDFAWQMLQEGAAQPWFGKTTPVVVVRLAVSTWQAACQAGDGSLSLTGADNRGSIGLGMAAGTTPSLAALRTGGWVAAFQANTTELWVIGADNRGSLRLGMMPGTSPGITALPAGGWQTAFHANDGKLWVAGADNRSLGFGMAPGTSPSIAALSTGGWIAAFQANSNELWIVGADNRGSLGLGMMPGTSPSIVALSTGGWVAAFQANTGDLWVVGTGTPGATGFGMMPATSPSITVLTTGGWEAAFQANTSMLWVVGADNRGSLGLGMKAATSPCIVAQPNGRWQVAFQANTGELWCVGAESRGATGLTMAAGTSPSIVRFPPR